MLRLHLRARSTFQQMVEQHRTHVTIHDPSIFSNKLLLRHRPLIARRGDKIEPPEALAKLNHERRVISPERLARVDLPDAPRPSMTMRFTFFRSIPIVKWHAHRCLIGRQAASILPPAIPIRFSEFAETRVRGKW